MATFFFFFGATLLLLLNPFFAAAAKLRASPLNKAAINSNIIYYLGLMKIASFLVAGALRSNARLRASERTEELLKLEAERHELTTKLSANMERQKLLALGLTEPLRPSDDFWNSARSRGSWLAGLLVCQSLSSFVLESYTETIQSHPTVVFFLTMLVGAGGNAGNQASVRIIRAKALGETPRYDDEIKMALVLATTLSVVGFFRVCLISDPADAFAITTSLFSIVFISVILGSLLPSILERIGAGPSNASTAIQVLMDIVGVAITCAICSELLDSPPLQLALSISASTPS